MQPAEMVNALDAIGWFRYRPVGAREELLRGLETLWYESEVPEWWLYQGLSDFSYTCDSDETDDGFLDLLRLYTSESRGLLPLAAAEWREWVGGRPRGLRWGREWEGKAPRAVAAQIGGSEYLIPYASRPSSTPYLTLHNSLNRVLKERGVPERFYIMPVVDDGVPVVLARPRQYRDAVRVGVVPTWPVPGSVRSSCPTRR